MRRDTDILKLTLKKQWFDLIASGEKKFEYREYTPHWIYRLLCKEGSRYFKEIRFTNGYGSDRPYMRVDFIGSDILFGEYCSPENGEDLINHDKYFVIELGKLLEIGNI